jgi:hypothetical protein
MTSQVLGNKTYRGKGSMELQKQYDVLQVHLGYTLGIHSSLSLGIAKAKSKMMWDDCLGSAFAFAVRVQKRLKNPVLRCTSQ